MYLVELFRHLWDNRKSAVIAIAILLVGNLVLIVLLQQFQTPEVFEREQFFVKRQAEVRQMLKQRGGQSEAPEQKFVAARGDLQTFNQAIPPYEDFTSLIEELLVLSERAGLKLTQISYQQKQDDKIDLLRFNLGFTLNGEYVEIKKFIHALEQSSRVLAIEQIGFQGRESDAAGVKVALRLQLVTLFQAKDKPS